MILVIHSLIDAVCQCKCCSTRSIQFQTMMFLNNLDIKSCCCQNLCSVLKQFHQSIDSERHICRFQNCDIPGSLFNLCKLFFT